MENPGRMPNKQMSSGALTGAPVKTSKQSSGKPQQRAPELFAHDGSPGYRLCLEGLQTRGATPVLDPERLKAVGIAEPEKVAERRDVVDWAAANGLITNPAFVDLIDGALTRAPCLCCCRAATLGKARSASELIRSMSRYFSREQYLASNGFYRTIERLLRDVTRDELASLKAYTQSLPSQPDVLHALNTYPGVCASSLPCRQHVMWVYSTVEGRRIIRHIARQCRKEGITALVYLATQRPEPVPRFAYRTYTVEVPKDEASRLWQIVETERLRLEREKRSRGAKSGPLRRDRPDAGRTAGAQPADQTSLNSEAAQPTSRDSSKRGAPKTDAPPR